MNRSIILAFVAVLMLVLLPAQAQDITIGELYSNETIGCPPEIVSGMAFNPPPAQLQQWPNLEAGVEIEGETYACGIVVVPENYDEPDGRKLELFYLRLFSSSQSPAPDPVIYLSGGPGQSASHEMSGIPGQLSNLNEVRERRDVIAYDQRGTGYSNYLICAPFVSAFGILEETTDDPDTVAGVEAIFADDIATQGVLKSICALAYNESGVVDLAQYNSVASARDIQSIVRALGFEEYNLYGTSYGTRLAQFAMRETADNIRSVVLDGVVAPSISNIAFTFASYFEHYEQIFKQCEEYPACAEAYPNLYERFATLLAELEATPLPVDPPILVDPKFLAKGAPQIEPILTEFTPDFFVGMAKINGTYLGGAFANYIPRIIHALEAGDIDYMRATIGTDPPEDAPSANELVSNSDPNPGQFVTEQFLFQQPLTALLTIAQQGAAQGEGNLDSYWISTVLGDFEQRLLAGDDQAAIVSDLLDLALMATAGAESQVLIDFADENLTAAAADLANGIVANMSQNDVRMTLWGLQDIANAMGTVPEARSSSSATQFAVNCAEDTGFASMEDSAAYLAASPFPQILIWPLESNMSFFTPCEYFPTPLDESVTELVTADIPTLIFQEGLDIATPFSWGVTVHEALPNSYFVEWRNMGHIAIGHDQFNCAGDIAAAFLDSPLREPDISCSQSDAYRLQWVLPE